MPNEKNHSGEAWWQAALWWQTLRAESLTLSHLWNRNEGRGRRGGGSVRTRAGYHPQSLLLVAHTLWLVFTS